MSSFGVRFVAAVVEAAINRFILDTAINADQSPRQVMARIGRLRACRDDEREEAQRSVFSAIERVLPDAAAHPRS